MHSSAVHLTSCSTSQYCLSQEPYGVNNPRTNLGCSPDGHGLRKGVKPGEGAIREVAAFLLDHKVSMLSPNFDWMASSALHHIPSRL